MPFAARRSVNGMPGNSMLEHAHAGHSDQLLSITRSRGASASSKGRIDSCCKQPMERSHPPLAMAGKGGYDVTESLFCCVHPGGSDRILVCPAIRQNETDRGGMKSTDATSMIVDMDPTCLQVSQETLRFPETAREPIIETSVPRKWRCHWIGEPDGTHRLGDHETHATATAPNLFYFSFLREDRLSTPCAVQSAPISAIQFVAQVKFTEVIR